MEQNSSHLKEEIARLHAIIDILISQNKTLNEEIAYLKTRNASPDVFSSHDDFEKGRTDVFSSNDKIEKVGNDALSSNYKIEKGRNNVLSSNDKIEKGRTDALSSNDKIEKGRISAFSSNENFEKGRNDVLSSHDKTEIGRNQSESRIPKTDIGRNDALSALPAFVEPTPAVAGKLAHLLRASGVAKVPSSTLRAMAAIMVRAHNKQDCSHQELRKLTGHSEGGIAKLLMAMKKRGLIYRDGFKRFGLSASSREMLRQAVAS